MPHHSKAPLLKEHRVSTVTYSITQWPSPINTFFIHHFFHSQIAATVPWSKASTTCSLENRYTNLISSRPVQHHLHHLHISSYRLRKPPQKNKVACCPMRQTKDRYSGYIWFVQWPLILSYGCGTVPVCHAMT